MKNKTIIVSLVMILTLVSLTTIYADTVTVGNSTFTLPEGYTLIENDTEAIMYNDDIAITMYQGSIIDPEKAKEKRVAMGYKLIGDYNYDFNGVKINQQNYNHDGVNTCIYTFKKNKKSYIISLNMYEDKEVPSYEDNPVTEIIYSLK